MKPGSEKSDNEKSVSKNLFRKISGRKMLQNENFTTKIPAVNISTKKINSRISDSKKLDEKKSDNKQSGDRSLT